MWKITLFCNILILVLLWMLSVLVITPINSLLVRYSEFGVVSPILTDFAIQVRPFAGIVPLSWAAFTLFFGIWLNKQPDAKRNEYLTTHTSVTLCLGFMELLFFSTAGVIPLLRMGAVL